MGSSEKREEKIPIGVPPLGVQAQNSSPIKWSTGLCSCDEDVGNCCLTCWCPCITFGRIAEITDRGATTCETGGAIYALLMLVGFPCIYSCCYRSKLRKQYSLLERPCPDFLVHCCCEECALCQEYRELERRGYDMSAGWHGNVQKTNPWCHHKCNHGR